MKKLILTFLLLVFLFGLLPVLNGQSWFGISRPEGVEVLSSLKTKSFQRSPSFFFKDSSNRFWVGLGGWLNNGTLNDKGGLISYKYGTDTLFTHYAEGIFTDYFDRRDSILFAAFDGLHTFKNGKFSRNWRYKNLTSMALHKNRLVLGSLGQGLWFETEEGYKSMIPEKGGIKYDSIHSLFSDGNELWLGTSKGLVKMERFTVLQGYKITKYDMPFNQWYQDVWDVKKDKYGRVWILCREAGNRLFILENEKITRVQDYFHHECYKANFLPLDVVKLYLNKKGCVMLKSSYNIVEFEERQINFYWTTLNDNYYKSSSYPGYVSVHTMYSESEDILYVIDAGNGVEMIKIDFSKYSEKIKKTPQSYANYEMIDINHVKSNVSDNGLHASSIFSHTYIPKSFMMPDVSCSTPLYVANLWLGGKNSQTAEYHIACEWNRQSGTDFKSGPIELADDTVAITKFYGVWKIDRLTIEEFKLYRDTPDYVIPKEIQEWPAHLDGYPDKEMAPFVDVDNNGKYEPQKGDYPKIKGDQMLWWIFHDLVEYSETGGKPMGVEVHGSSYAYFHRELGANHPDEVVNRTVFFNYKVINYSDNDYADFRMGIHNWFTLGNNYLGNHIGSDTLNNAAFAYKPTNFDYDSVGEYGYGYGQNPPFFFCKFFNQKMTSFLAWNNNWSPISGNPERAIDYYNYLDGKWRNGTSLTYGGNGSEGGVETNYMYSGAICGDSGWTERSANIPAGEKPTIMATGLPLFKKDSVFELEFAYIFLHDPSVDFLEEECDKPSQALQKMQHWYDTESFPSLPFYPLHVELAELPVSKLLLYPNPANSRVTLTSDIENSSVFSVEIVDYSGKLIYKSAPDSNHAAFYKDIDVSGFASGIYLVKVSTQEGILSQKMVKE